MFGQTTELTWFFESSVHLEAVSRLLYLIETHAPLGVLCGPDGSGRTSVLLKLKAELQRSATPVISLNLSGMDEESILLQLAPGAGAVVRSGMRRAELLGLLRDELIGRTHCGVPLVVLMDDVHRTTSDISPLIQMLVNLSAQCSGRLTVIASVENPMSIDHSELGLVRVGLTPLDFIESADFVRSLAQRHSLSSTVLDESAIRLVSETTRGNAARISRICELLSVVHETDPSVRITSDTVRTMLAELTFENPGWN